MRNGKNKTAVAIGKLETSVENFKDEVIRHNNDTEARYSKSHSHHFDRAEQQGKDMAKMFEKIETVGKGLEDHRDKHWLWLKVSGYALGAITSLVVLFFVFKDRLNP